ncbi:MAG: AMP-binding protein [Chthoniobacteraceae bacterium]
MRTRWPGVPRRSGTRSGMARLAAQAALEREYRPVPLTSTTGRSCEPVPFTYTQRDLDVLAEQGRRIMEISGARREMRMLNLFPFAPHLAFWQTHYAGTGFGVFVVSTGGGKTLGTDGNLRLIRRLQPDVLIGMPTFLYHVLSEAVQEGVTCPKLCKIVLGGEKVPEGVAKKLRQLAREIGAGRVDILPTYGFTEAKMAFPQCPVPEGEEMSGYHLSPDLGLVEIVDPKTGQPVPDGEPGELVFTSLVARGSVVVRYRTGDVIEGGLTFEPCPHCGRTVPRLRGAISRRSDVREMQLDKLKGTLVDFNQLEHVLDNVDHLGTWQLELRKANDDPLERDELILHVQTMDGADEGRLRTMIEKRMAAETELHPDRVIFHEAGEMRRLQGVGTELKEQRVVDHRPAENKETQPAPTAPALAPHE